MYYLKLLALLIICASCGTRGRIVENRYYDPSGWYSVEVPISEPKISETINEVNHSLTMAGNFDNIYKVDILNCSEEAFKTINAIINGGDNSEILNMLILQSFLRGSRKSLSCCLYESGAFVDPNFGAAYFTLLEVKGGSDFRNFYSNQARNSYAAFLIFSDNSKIVVLSYVFDPLSMQCLKNNVMDYPKLKELYLEELMEFREGYRSY